MAEKPNEPMPSEAVIPADSAPQTPEPRTKQPHGQHRGIAAVKRRSLRKDGKERKGRSDNWIPDEKELISIEAAAGLLKNLAQVAHVVGVHPQTLVKKMRDMPDLRAAIERGRAKANYNVGHSLYINATKNENVEAQKFWLKARAGWRDTERIELARGPDYETYSEEDLEAEICEQERLLGLMEQVEIDRTKLVSRVRTTPRK